MSGDTCTAKDGGAKHRKIISQETLRSTCANARSHGHKIGLITGCFDVIHLGHIDLFRWAKEKVRVNLLVVGIEDDAAIKATKGPRRPFFTSGQRAEVLAELECVDRVFVLPRKRAFFGEQADAVYRDLLMDIVPTVVISHPGKDSYWEHQKKLVAEVNASLHAMRPTDEEIECVECPDQAITSSSDIGRLLLMLDVEKVRMPTVEDQRFAFRLLLEKPEQKAAILDLWRKCWPYDEWIERLR